MTTRRNALLALSLLLPAAGLLAARAGERPAAPPAALGELAWLQGTWRANAEDGSFMEETWSAASGDAMCGMFRMAAAGGRVHLYELMSIELEGPAAPATDPDGPIIPGQERGAPQRLVFRLRHFDRGLQPWKAEAAGPLAFTVKSLGANEAVFEDRERDFPREVAYRREGETLRIRLVSATEERPDMEFALQRAAE